MTDPETPQAERDALDDRPPLLGSWRNLYFMVIGTLATLVTIFWWLTRHYA